MRVIVMGCGKVGEQLCRMLVSSGNDVTVIDADPANLDRLGDQFRGRKVIGIGFDRDVLVQAGIEECEAFAATGPIDNANIIAARIARNIFHVPRVVARLYDPRRAEIYRRLGLVTISMTTWGAERIHEVLTHTNLDPIMSFGRGEVSLITLEIPPHLEGRRVKDLTVPGEIQVMVITREGEAILPVMGSEFHSGDLVHLVLHAAAQDRLDALIGI
jgi:trk system potassium uptake protein TrkA